MGYPDEGGVSDNNPSKGNGNDTGNIKYNYPSNAEDIMAWYQQTNICLVF